jgi:hypothetical protein
VHFDFCTRRRAGAGGRWPWRNPEGGCDAGPPRVVLAVHAPDGNIAMPRTVSRGGRMSGPIVVNNPPPEGNSGSNTSVILGVVIVVVILIVVWLLFANGGPAPTPGPGAS